MKEGLFVLVALPTARMATRMQGRLGKHGNLTVDTFHAAFQFHKPEEEALFCMHGYDLVLVDEFSRLEKWHYERILKQWECADRVPCLTFLGDKQKLAGYGEERPWESTAWSKTQVEHITLHQVFRAEDPGFLETLNLLRTSMPSKVEVARLCRGRKAWLGPEPTPSALGRLRKQHPEATFVAASRAGVKKINDLMLQALYPKRKPLAILDGAWEDEPENYDVGGKLREHSKKKPLITSKVPIHKDLQIYLTRNIRKEDDFVNGMLCTVKKWDAKTGIIWAETETGKMLPITKWSDPEHDKLVYYPIRLGYCSTVHKVQGDEFPFIIIYMDKEGMPGVGYTALSRVKNADSYKLGGKVTRKHFTPVTAK